MRFKARRGTVRKMTPQQEAAMIRRQRDSLLKWLEKVEQWCPLVEVNDVRAFFPVDPTGDEDPDPSDRYPSRRDV